ncbi:MAG: amidohydrolase family protein, partial [Oscillibacter sp.]
MGQSVVLRDCKFLFASSNPSDIQTDVSVLVQGNTITAIGPYDQLLRTYGADDEHWDVVDCRNKLVMPGLVDGHNHLCNTHMNLARVFGVNYNHIAEHMLTTIHDPYGWMSRECLYDVSLLSALNDIKHGATTIQNSTILPDVAIQSMREAGCRGILSPQMATSFRLENDDLNWREMLSRTERCIREYHDPDHGMSVAVHIHDQWDTLEEVMVRGMDLAE